MKARAISLFLTVVFLIVCFSLHAEGTVVSRTPSHLVLLGDSIASGYGLPTSGENYGEKLAAAFHLVGKGKYVNLAVPGATSSDLKALLSAGKTAELMAAVRSADTILISIGGNDVLKPFSSKVQISLNLSSSASSEQIQAASKYKSAVRQFSSNLSCIASEIHKASPRAQLYIQTIYNPFDGVDKYAALSVVTESILSDLNRAIVSEAALSHYRVVDVHAAFAGKAQQWTNIASGDIHPNAVGHTEIFRLVEQTILNPDLSGKTALSTKPSGSDSSASCGTSSGGKTNSQSGAVAQTFAVDSPSSRSETRRPAGSSPLVVAGIPAILILAGVVTPLLRFRHKNKGTNVKR